MSSYFPEEGIWLKGCLHSHSTVSDGEISPEELAENYKNRGYDFLAMTDHNVLCPHKDLESDDFILLTGLEHDLNYSDEKCIHLVGISAEGKKETSYPCRRYTRAELDDQALLDMMREDGQFTILAHPVWSRMEPQELDTLEGFHAMEIYNHGTEHVGHEGEAEYCWELLLRHGRRVYALATDDIHIRREYFGGWVVVKAEDKSEKAILNALHSGAFYASSGPDIYDFGIDGDEAYIKCSPCKGIYFVSYPSRGWSFFDRDEFKLSEARHKLHGREKYIRAVVEDKDGNRAWTNPIFFD